MAANEVERERWNAEQWVEAWPRRERLTDAVTPSLLEAAALRPGERVLDVGCGGGKTTLAAAEAVGPEGRVVGADVSVPLARLAAGRAQAAGVGNVAFRVLDAQTDGVEGAPFDVAISQFGVMFFDEPETAFANIRAQLAPNGRLAFACWQGQDANPWFFAGAVAGFVPPPPDPAPGKSATGPFALADPGRTTEILRRAGFAAIERTPYELDVEVPEDSVVDDAQLAFMGVAPERLDDARAAVDAHMRRFRLDSGLSRFPLAFQVFRARA